MIRDFTRTAWRVGDVQNSLTFTLNGRALTLNENKWEITELHPKQVVLYGQNTGMEITLVPSNCPIMAPNKATRERVAMMQDD